MRDTLLPRLGELAGVGRSARRRPRRPVPSRSRSARRGTVIGCTRLPSVRRARYLADYHDPAWSDPGYLNDEYGLWIIGEQHTDVFSQGGATYHDTGQEFLPSWTNAFVHTGATSASTAHPPGQPDGTTTLVVAPATEDGGIPGDGVDWA